MGKRKGPWNKTKKKENKNLSKSDRTNDKPIFWLSLGKSSNPKFIWQPDNPDPRTSLLRYNPYSTIRSFDFTEKNEFSISWTSVLEIDNHKQSAHVWKMNV